MIEKRGDLWYGGLELMNLKKPVRFYSDLFKVKAEDLDCRWCQEKGAMYTYYGESSHRPEGWYPLTEPEPVDAYTSDDLDFEEISDGAPDFKNSGALMEPVKLLGYGHKASDVMVRFPALFTPSKNVLMPNIQDPPDPPPDSPFDVGLMTSQLEWDEFWKDFGIETSSEEDKEEPTEATSSEYPKEEAPKEETKSEGDRLVDFFFPKNR